MAWAEEGKYTGVGGIRHGHRTVFGWSGQTHESGYAQGLSETGTRQFVGGLGSGCELIPGSSRSGDTCPADEA